MRRIYILLVSSLHEAFIEFSEVIVLGRHKIQYIDSQLSSPFSIIF